jgi:hypothetical protein
MVKRKSVAVKKAAPVVEPPKVAMRLEPCDCEEGQPCRCEEEQPCRCEIVPAGGQKVVAEPIRDLGPARLALEAAQSDSDVKAVVYGLTPLERYIIAPEIADALSRIRGAE